MDRWRLWLHPRHSCLCLVAETLLANRAEAGLSCYLASGARSRVGGGGVVEVEGKERGMKEQE